MGLQKEALSIKMVDELELTCTPTVYLDETEKLHRQLFPDVCFSWLLYRKRYEYLSKHKQCRDSLKIHQLIF